VHTNEIAQAASALALGQSVPGARTAADPREARATPQLVRFLALTAQLTLLLVVFKAFRLEEPGFFALSCAMFGGFAVHYWLPFQLKQPFWIALSIAGAFLLLETRVAVLLIAVGLALFGILASRLPYVARVAVVAVVFAGVMYGRATPGFELGSGWLYVPPHFWTVFGGVFMFRMIVYLYDLRHMRERPSVRDFLGYFFLLPNYYFLLFPVIDFQTLKRGFFARDIHDVAQQGIHWIVRGTIQLLIYRLIYHLKPPSTPDVVTSAESLAIMMVLTYLLYLRVSGQFHIIVGMLHLYGYDLPETQRRYLLASSLTDFWRRINIYWKDFMVKVVYFPAYFRLRKHGEARAQVIATGLVFVATWLLHSYQYFWLTGRPLLSWPDVTFWTILGVLMVGNVLLELRRPRPVAAPPLQRRLLRVPAIAGTFATICVLWSLWNAPSLTAWFDLITWWRIG
jgi:hypothetical protein